MKFMNNALILTCIFVVCIPMQYAMGLKYQLLKSRRNFIVRCCGAKSCQKIDSNDKTLPSYTPSKATSSVSSEYTDFQSKNSDKYTSTTFSNSVSSNFNQEYYSTLTTNVPTTNITTNHQLTSINVQSSSSSTEKIQNSIPITTSTVLVTVTLDEATTTSEYTTIPKSLTDNYNSTTTKFSTTIETSSTEVSTTIANTLSTGSSTTIKTSSTETSTTMKNSLYTESSTIVETITSTTTTMSTSTEPQCISLCGCYSQLQMFGGCNGENMEGKWEMICSNKRKANEQNVIGLTNFTVNDLKCCNITLEMLTLSTNNRKKRNTPEIFAITWDGVYMEKIRDTVTNIGFNLTAATGNFQLLVNKTINFSLTRMDSCSNLLKIIGSNNSVCDELGEWLNSGKIISVPPVTNLVSTFGKRNLLSENNQIFSYLSSFQTIKDILTLKYPNSTLVDPGDGNLYSYFYDLSIYDTARSNCKLRCGMDLVHIIDANQNSIVATIARDAANNLNLWPSLFPTGVMNLFMGLETNNTGASYEWLRSYPLTFSKWYPGDPNDNLLSRNCPFMYVSKILPNSRHSFWYDTINGCNKLFPYMCYINPIYYP